MKTIQVDLGCMDQMNTSSSVESKYLAILFKDTVIKM